MEKNYGAPQPLSQSDFEQACRIWQEKGTGAAVGFIFNRLQAINNGLPYHPREVYQLVVRHDLQEIVVGALERLAVGTVLFDPGTNDWLRPLCGLLERVDGQVDAFRIRRFSPPEVEMSLTIGPTDSRAVMPGRVCWNLGPNRDVSRTTFCRWPSDPATFDGRYINSCLSGPIDAVFIEKDRWKKLLNLLARWLPVESTGESSTDANLDH